MRAAEAMSSQVLAVTPADSISVAARAMDERGVAAAVVESEELAGPGILTARDIVAMAANGEDPQVARVEDHFTRDAVVGEPEWSLERAAEAMVSGRFRHVIIVEAGRITGVLSIRDIVARWLRDRGNPAVTIQISEAMNRDFLTVDRKATMRDVAASMIEKDVGAALVSNPARFAPPDIVSERDLVRAAGRDQVLGQVAIADELESRTTYSAHDWSLRQAAEAMVKGNFQHVVVVDFTGVIGVIAMREILGRWLR